MNYRVFSTQDSDCSHILPPALCRMARTGEVLVFAGEEKEGELECVAAFSPSPHDRDEAVLQYLYVPQEKRNSGRAHGLLEFSRKELRSTGVRMITARECTQNTTLGEFLRHEGFLPLSFRGRLYECPLSAFTGNALLQKIPEERCRPVRNLSDCGDIQVRHFMERAAREGFRMKAEVGRQEFCLVYEEGQELTACLMGEKQGDDFLFLARSHRLSICREAAAWAFMFAACIRNAEQTMKPETVVQIQSFDKGEQGFLQKLAGSEEGGRQIREWACRI